MKKLVKDFVKSNLNLGEPNCDDFNKNKFDFRKIFTTIFLLTLVSAVYTKTQDEIDLKFYDLVEDVLKEKYPNDTQTRSKTFARLKNDGTIEEIYDPELLSDTKRLKQVLESFLLGEKNRTTHGRKSEETIKVHQIVIKNETSPRFDVCSLFTVQFFIGIAVGFVLGLPVGVGILSYLRRGKTYNYAINKPLPTPPT